MTFTFFLQVVPSTAPDGKFRHRHASKFVKVNEFISDVSDTTQQFENFCIYDLSSILQVVPCLSHPLEDLYVSDAW